MTDEEDPRDFLNQARGCLGEFLGEFVIGLVLFIGSLCAIGCWMLFRH